MDIEVLRKELDPVTFRPFDIVLVNGATFAIPYPDTLFIPEARPGRRVPRFVHLFHEEDGTGRTIDPAMVAQIVHRDNGKSTAA